jgi:ABC-type phosphate/phosphonate transport system substrate-binding protein
MKKVFMSVAVVALMVAASACGNNAKKAEAAETEAAAEEVEAVADTVAACCDSTAACCDSTVVAE